MKSFSIDLAPILDDALGPLFSEPPEIAVILGSGLGDFGDELENSRRIFTADLPGYPRSTVPGHQGAVISGRLAGKRLICFQGRVHLYEGYRVDEVVLPVRLAAELGAKALILTNAAGGINPHLEPGSLVLIVDQVDLQFRLRIRSIGGEKHALLRIERQRFFDAVSPYSDRLIAVAKGAALAKGIGLYPGVLGALLGPSYETPAEVRMERRIGVDAACMSTVAEAAEGARLEMEVLGISCITNRAAGLTGAPLDHSEVIETASRVKDQFTILIKEIIRRI